MSVELFLVYVVVVGFVAFAAFMMLDQAVRAWLGSRARPMQAEEGANGAELTPPALGDAEAPQTAASHKTQISFPSEFTLVPVPETPSAPSPQPVELVIEPRDEIPDLIRKAAAPMSGAAVLIERKVLEVAPLAYMSAQAPRPPAVAICRSRPIIFDPEHYRRHAGVAGYLYMARNSFYYEGLYKLGYTTQTPQERINLLNKEHRQKPDVGEFHLVHAVQVPAAYDAETALFELLGANRPVQQREFFLQHEAVLKAALEATRAFTTGNDGALDDFVVDSAHQIPMEHPAAVRNARVPPLTSSKGGWIYVTRCQWHRSNLYRVSFTRKDPRNALSALDARQKRLTCRIGFHTLVHCVSVEDLQASWGEVATSIERWRVLNSKVFYDAPIEELSEAIHQACAVSQVQGRAKREIPLGNVSVEWVHGQVASSWAAWARPCPACGAVLRFTGTVGAQGQVGCPACGCQLECAVGASKAMVTAMPSAS